MHRTLTIIAVAWVVSSRAATYYVDYAGGNDTNAGTATGLAWKHCPGDPTATGNPAAATLAPGDTVIFKGGVSYLLLAPWSNTGDTAGIALNWNGSAGSPVTYDGNSAGAWGSGRAILTDNHGTNAMTAFKGTNACHDLVLRSFEIGPIGGAATLPPDPGVAVPANPGAGINLTAGVTNLTVRDCYFHELGYWFNQKPMDDAAISGLGIQCFGGPCDQITVSNCSFARQSIACNFTTAPLLTRLTLANCQFTDSIRWCVDLGPTAVGTTFDGLSVHDCTFYDFYQLNQTYWTGYGGWPHTDGIFLRCDFTNCVFGVLNFYNNLFYFTTNAGGGTASIYVTEGPSVNLYNNLFINTGQAYGSIGLVNGPQPGGSPQTVNVFNNTFYNSYADAFYVGYTSSTRPVQKLVVLNNVCYDAKTGSGNNFIFSLNTLDSSAATNWFFNHNLYKSFNIDGTWGYWPGVGGELSFAVTAYGHAMQEYGWETNGVAADPKFVDLSYGIGPQDNLNNFQLQAGSPAIGAGTNLSAYSSLVGIAADRTGITRPASGAWDIGAYVFATNLPAVTLTANPTSISAGEFSTLTWSSSNSTNQTLLPGIGPVGASGSTNVYPSGTTLYTFTAIGPGGTNSAGAMVIVNTPLPWTARSGAPAIGRKLMGHL